MCYNARRLSFFFFMIKKDTLIPKWFSTCVSLTNNTQVYKIRVSSIYYSSNEKAKKPFELEFFSLIKANMRTKLHFVNINFIFHFFNLAEFVGTQNIEST